MSVGVKQGVGTETRLLLGPDLTNRSGTSMIRPESNHRTCRNLAGVAEPNEADHASTAGRIRLVLAHSIRGTVASRRVEPTQSRHQPEGNSKTWSDRSTLFLFPASAAGWAVRRMRIPLRERGSRASTEEKEGKR